MEVQRIESRTRVWLNNIGLQDIDPSIIVHDVSYQANPIDAKTFDLPKFHGSRLMLRRFGVGIVTVAFEIHEYSQIFRQSILERIVAWAMTGGALTCDDRPGKRLYVACTGAPAIDSTQKWTNQLSITFTAFDNPFWEDINPIQTELTGTNVSGQIYGIGSAVGPYIEVKAVCSSGTLSSITLNVGSTSIKLEEIVIISGYPLWIYYDAKHVQHIVRRHGDSESSLMTNRTTSSDDDLIANLGVYTPVSFVADNASTVTFMARGLYT